MGARQASVAFNRFADAEIEQAVERARRLAELAPEDPEHLPLLGPVQTYPAVAAYFDTTAELGAGDRADAVATVAEGAAAAGVEAAGYLPREAEAVAVANSAGLFAYHRSTLAAHTMTVRTESSDGSGWAGSTHNDWAHVTPPEVLTDRAVEKARASAGAQPVSPGAYTVILEPTAVGNLVRLLRSALDARAADDGRSAFSSPGGGTRVGERVAQENVTILSDPADPDLLALPFTDEGLPVGRTVWIEDGILRNLSYRRFYAREQDREPVPMAGGLKMLGGAGSAADLLQDVDYGILVTRFWYIRSVDPRTLLYTGLTRDGTFLIENGRVSRPVKNLRFNQSITAMLRDLIAVGSPERVVASESGGLGGAIAVPPLVVRNFRFTSVSDAV